jgi:FAD/FMN-containing dehydrogenase
MTVIDIPTSLGARLDSRLDGRVVTSLDADWDAARQAYNLAVDQHPAAVAFPEDEDDVASVVRFARKHGLRVAAQRSGHNAAPLRSLEQTILVKTDALQGVEIDAGARRARVRAGAKWENVVPQASELGLAALHGSAADVGIVGYSLGGGLGWYARKLGLASNSVTAIELVTADGEIVRADHAHDAELFWALRGGGGNFGVVTALEFALYPISEVYAGVLFFPFRQAREVLHTWHELTASAPEELTWNARIMQFPPLPELPEPLRGNAFAVIDAAFVGTKADGDELLGPLRRLSPTMDTFATVPPVGLSGLHMDPPEPMPFVSDHLLLGDLPSTGIDEFVDLVTPGSPLLMVELRQTGGALARSAPHHGALATLDGSFAFFAGGLAPDESAARAARAELDYATAVLEPYDAGTSYSNFTESKVDPALFFGADAYRRLRDVKAAVDPDDLFQANHPISPAAERE